jgi:hypothetical protein
MNDQTEIGSIEFGNDLKGLNNRRALAKMAIYTLDHIGSDELATMGFDPADKVSSMDHYKKQLAEIDTKIEAITGTPPPIVVGLKTAKLFGEAGKIS